MKVLAVLCLLGLVAAEPQVILPYTTNLLTPTIKADGGVISTYTATYPNAGFPSIRAPLPYNFGYYPYSIPTILAAKPAEDTTGRQKRSADPEPAINFPQTGSAITTPAATIPATLATIPTTLNYQYTGLPAAVSAYTVPQTIPYTGVSPFVGAYPFTTGLTPYTTGLTPYTTGLGPYTTNWPYVQPFVSTIKADSPKLESGGRAKRSADPEADPQLLTTTTGVTGFTYPAVNTYTVPQTIPYTGVSPFVGAYPFTTGLTPYTTGLTPYTTGLGPYTTNWPYVQPFVGTIKADSPKLESGGRAKRSADPEADPQLLTTTTGVTGFAYPAINTGTVVPSTYTYSNLPIHYPTTYNTGIPFRTPLTTVYG